MAENKTTDATLSMGRRTFVVGSGGAVLLWACGDTLTDMDAGNRRDSGSPRPDAATSTDAGRDSGTGPQPMGGGIADGNVLRSTLPMVGDADIVLFSSGDGQRVLEIAPFLQQPGYAQLSTPFDGPLLASAEDFRTGVLQQEVRREFGDSIVAEALELLAYGPG